MAVFFALAMTALVMTVIRQKKRDDARTQKAQARRKMSENVTQPLRDPSPA